MIWFVGNSCVVVVATRWWSIFYLVPRASTSTSATLTRARSSVELVSIERQAHEVAGSGATEQRDLRDVPGVLHEDHDCRPGQRDRRAADLERVGPVQSVRGHEDVRDQAPQKVEGCATGRGVGDDVPAALEVPSKRGLPDLPSRRLGEPRAPFE